jgi:hypothetical protein
MKPTTKTKTKRAGKSPAYLKRHHTLAWETVGGLSSPSKMPCYGYSTPATACATGGRLQKVSGSTCSGCYAMKGFYRMPNVASALAKRLDSLTSPAWVPAMVELIDAAELPYFRWHDSGDLQNVDHLASIVAVCESTPKVTHWLPTREVRIVRDFLKAGGEIPSNLTIRVSAHMIDRFPGNAPMGLPFSTVHTDESVLPSGAEVCGAAKRGGECGPCRACWEPSNVHISYAKH